MGTTRYTNDEFISAVKNSESWRQVCGKLRLKYAGGNVKQLKKRASDLQVDHAHFKGRGWNIGGVAKNARPLEDCLKRNFYIKASVLKEKLLKAGQIEEVCGKCGIGPIWENKQLVLELDHIDGDPLNNERDNLRLLCPNCHSQTETFRGRKRAGVA